MLPEWVYQECPRISAAHRDAAFVRQCELTKPAGALGRLEVVAIELAGMQHTDRPRAARAPITPYTMALQEKTLKGTLYGSVRPTVDFPQLVQLYLDGRLKLDQLISRTYTLAEINKGFEMLRTGQVARGVVVFA